LISNRRSRASRVACRSARRGTIRLGRAQCRGQIHPVELSSFRHTIEHMVDTAVEKVAPSQIEVDDVLFLLSVIESEWGLVTDITEHLNLDSPTDLVFY
jgi:hypothetical protein